MQRLIDAEGVLWIEFSPGLYCKEADWQEWEYMKRRLENC